MIERWRVSEPITAIVLGARGGVGGALLSSLEQTLPTGSRVLATARQHADRTPEAKSSGGATVEWAHADLTEESSLVALTARATDDASAPLRLVINAAGLLHDHAQQPERRYRDLDQLALRRAFDVNAVGVALLIKHLIPAFPRKGRSVFATLSARVGSIEDNRIGGWYAYRASKAAQNMLVKCATIEGSRIRPEAVIVALHPGTVATALSEPFTKRLPDSHAVFTPAESAEYLRKVLAGLEPDDSGGHFAWDGERIPG